MADSDLTTNETTPELEGESPKDFAAMDLTFEPAFSVEKVDELERTAQEVGVMRRCALAMLSQTQEKVLGFAREEPEAATDLLECISSLIDHLKAQTETMESCFARLAWALSKSLTEEKSHAHNPS